MVTGAVFVDGIVVDAIQSRIGFEGVKIKLFGDGIWGLICVAIHFGEAIELGVGIGELGVGLGELSVGIGELGVGIGELGVGFGELGVGFGLGNSQVCQKLAELFVGFNLRNGQVRHKLFEFLVGHGGDARKIGVVAINADILSIALRTELNGLALGEGLMLT